MSARDLSNAQLDALIQMVYAQCRGRYGYRRMHKAVQQSGFQTSRNRVARRMTHLNLRATKRRKWKKTTDSKHNRDVAPNVLDREFNPDSKNIAWATDVTFVHTDEGWLHLSVMLDLFSRRVVGWATSKHNDTDLALRTLKMAVGQRQPNPGWIHHSDQGSPYASYRYETALKNACAVRSMSEKGDCYDNAVVESFFGTMKREMEFRSRRFITREEAHREIVNYIVWYNADRLHSSLDYVSPNNFEASRLMKNVA